SLMTSLTTSLRSSHEHQAGGANGAVTEELPTAFSEFAGRMTDAVNDNPERSAKQLQDAKDRYVFIRQPDAPPT
uniref:hypothetical protein n=1 Tax=uncultured Aliiroseovarius sp. TaxID=1658783 RepID=UPI002597BC0E